MASSALSRHSLKTRITVVTMLIFLVGIWTLALYATQLQQKETKQLLSEQHFATASLIAAEIGHELIGRAEALKQMAGEIPQAGIARPAILPEFFAEHPVFTNLFNAGVMVVDVNGQAIADYPSSRERLGLNFMDRDYVAGALRENKVTVGAPVIAKKAKVPVFGMAAPLRDAQGKVIGALAGLIILGESNFLTRTIESGIGNDIKLDYLIVSRKSRQIVVATDRSRNMERLPAPGVDPHIDQFIGGMEGTAVYVNRRGVEVLVSAKTIPGSDWYVMSSIPTSEAFAAIRAMHRRMLLAAIALTLGAGIFIWWILRWQLSQFQ